MRTTLLASLAITALLSVSVPAGAVAIVDTGTPGGAVTGAYAVDRTDFVAGRIGFGHSLRIDAVSFHVLGGTAGETFTVALYTDGPTRLPDSVVYSGTATLGADGWNGLSGLSGWTLDAGNYWLALELGPFDDAGSGSLTGLLLDRGVPRPLSDTAFDAGGGYRAATLDFGLQVDATPIPEPGTFLLTGLGIGLGLYTIALRTRRRQR